MDARLSFSIIKKKGDNITLKNNENTIRLINVKSSLDLTFLINKKRKLDMKDA
jgi:hypothetical protein